jgi:hypothetical protein
MLAVLDLERDALAAEQKRLAGQSDAVGLVVEAIDRATWFTMRRLQATGLVQLADGPVRVLHCVPELAAADGSTGDPAEQAAELSRQALRTLRMARVLATGGFPEEGLPLIAKAIGQGAAVKLAQRGGLAAGATMATPVQIRDLAERNVLPAAAVTVLTALWSRAGTASSEIAGLLETAVEVVTACLDGGEHQLAA